MKSYFDICYILLDIYDHNTSKISFYEFYRLETLRQNIMSLPEEKHSNNEGNKTINQIKKVILSLQESIKDIFDQNYKHDFMNYSPLFILEVCIDLIDHESHHMKTNKNQSDSIMTKTDFILKLDTLYQKYKFECYHVTENRNKDSTIKKTFNDFFNIYEKKCEAINDCQWKSTDKKCVLPAFVKTCNKLKKSENEKTRCKEEYLKEQQKKYNIDKITDFIEKRKGISSSSSKDTINMDKDHNLGLTLEMNDNSKSNNSITEETSSQSQENVPTAAEITELVQKANNAFKKEWRNICENFCETKKSQDKIKCYTDCLFKHKLN